MCGDWMCMSADYRLCVLRVFVGYICWVCWMSMCIKCLSVLSVYVCWVYMLRMYIYWVYVCLQVCPWLGHRRCIRNSKGCSQSLLSFVCWAARRRWNSRGQLLFTWKGLLWVIWKIREDTRAGFCPQPTLWSHGWDLSHLFLHWTHSPLLFPLK